MSRIRRVDSEKEQDRLIDDFLTRGYNLKQRGQYSAKVKEVNWGSAPVHGFIFIFALLVGSLVVDAAALGSGVVWLLVGLAHLSYAGYSRLTAEEVVIKVDSETPT